VEESEFGWLRMLEAEFETKIEFADGGGTVLIKSGNQHRRGSFDDIIVNEDVARERTL